LEEREQLVFRSKVAEQAECFDEMVESMKKVLELGADLSVEERNLLSIAYKNLIGGKRTAWRIVNSLEEKEKHKDPNSWKLQQMSQLRQSIEHQLNKVSGEILDLIEKKLIPSASGTESKVFWHKMKGDYHRYIAEYERERKQNVTDEAFKAYQQALEEGKVLAVTNSILLGLALNFSVFYYEILNDKDKACEMAKKYFDAAIPEIDKLDGDEYKDTTLILQLLRDNLSLWTASSADDDESE